MEKEKIIELAKGLYCLDPFNDKVAGKTRYSVIKPTNIASMSCQWSRESIGEAFVDEVVGTFETIHSFGHPSLFKPSVKEIIESIPTDKIKQANAFSIVCVGLDDDCGHHIAETTLYKAHFELRSNEKYDAW